MTKIKAKKKTKKRTLLKKEKLFFDLTRLRFTVRNETYELELGEELIIGETDLHTQVEKIPAILGYIGSIVASLEREYEDKKALMKRIEAKIDKAIRITGTTGEVRIQKAIQRQPAWIEAILAVNLARENWTRAKSLSFSLRTKHESMITRSADIRANPSDSIMGVAVREILPRFSIKEDDEEDDYED